MTDAIGPNPMVAPLAGPAPEGQIVRDMLKKAAIGAPVIVAVSAPTALALRMAEACGMTLVAIARTDGFEVFTHPHRIKGELATHVA